VQPVPTWCSMISVTPRGCWLRSPPSSLKCEVRDP
jgi:hypothetical protein